MQLKNLKTNMSYKHHGHPRQFVKDDSSLHGFIKTTYVNINNHISNYVVFSRS